MDILTRQYVDARILLVDDDITNNLLLENALCNHGFRHVKSITDPRLVSDIFLEFNPELILLDLEMPHLNGFQVFNILQRLTKKDLLPVIMITVKNDIDSKNRALGLGIQYFIEKPFDKIELLTKVQNILHITCLLNQSAQRNKELELKIESEKKQVVEMENKAVERMLLTIKFRDQETGEHLNRISHLVYILSKNMGLDEELSTNIAEASKLHDIGKIGIPDNILCKEGKLDEEEWRIMKDHTVIGERILSVGESELLKLAGLIARSHHENWDGTGYPSGLVGEQIPIAGRILGVADVFDALLSNRPYKKAWDIESAIEFVRDESGKKFDPAIVKAFLKNIDKIVSMYNGSTQTKMLII